MFFFWQGCWISQNLRFRGLKGRQKKYSKLAKRQFIHFMFDLFWNMFYLYAFNRRWEGEKIGVQNCNSPLGGWDRYVSVIVSIFTQRVSGPRPNIRASITACPKASALKALYYQGGILTVNGVIDFGQSSLPGRRGIYGWMDLDVLNTDVSIGCTVHETEASTASSERSGRLWTTVPYMVHEELVLSDHVVPTSALTPVVFFLDIILDII